MSHIFLKKDQKEVLKLIIFNLTKVKQSDGKITMTKRKNTTSIYTEIYIPKDIVKIICDYDEEEIELSILSIIKNCNPLKNTVSVRIEVFLDNLIKVIYTITGNKCHQKNLNRLYVHNIMNDVFDLRRSNLILNNGINTIINEYKNSQKNPVHEWKYDIVYSFIDCDKFDYFIDINQFFNCYMQTYYNKIKYLHTYSNEVLCTFDDNIFVNTTKARYHYNKYIVILITPFDHKKLKNIIVIMKVMQIQLNKIMDEIVNTDSLWDKFNFTYEEFL